MFDCGLVSVIMPNYNCGRFIAQSITSVLVQTYKNWELIIVDDCSTDDSREVIEHFVREDKRVRLFVNEQNSGAALSRNKALLEAQGRWIAFLDSDDLWESKKLEHQLNFMITNSYYFSYTCYQEINEKTMSTGVYTSGPKRITKLGMYAFCWPGCLTVMYDRDYYGLLQIEDIKKNNDYAMWLKVCENADCYLLDECLAKYRRDRAGSVSNHSYFTMIRWHYKLWNEAMKKNPISSLFWTGMNIAFGVYKKLVYVKRTK